MKYRTVFISDLHLGSKGCNSKNLLKFLKEIEAEKIILVGDIVDFWAIKRKSFWPQSHNNIVQQLLKISKNGTKIVYIPGNHDEALRGYLNLTLGSNIEIVEEHEHVSEYGEKILCLHGDKFDIIMKNYKVLTFFGDLGYTILLNLNPLISNVRKRFGKKNSWSLSGFLKKKVKSRLAIMNRFEESAKDYATSKEYDSVICGHTHIPEVIKFENFTYYNCGDWVDSCTYLVEEKGEIKLLKWEESQ